MLLRRAVSLALALSTLSLASVVGAQPRTPAATVAPARTLRDLPPPGEPRSAALIAAVRLAEAALRLRPPRVATGSASVERSSQTRLAAWLRRKAETLRTADAALGRLATRMDPEAVVAVAIIAFLNDDFARAVTELPLPTFGGDLEMQNVYASQLELQATSMIERARLGYQTCQQFGTRVGGAVALAYRTACAAREEAIGVFVATIAERARVRASAAAAVPARTNGQSPPPPNAPMLLGPAARPPGPPTARPTPAPPPPGPAGS